MAKPIIVVDPSPRGLDEIFDSATWARLEALGALEIHRGDGQMPAARLDALLPEAELLIGQSDMPKARLDRAPKLRAIVNVETNFLQNVDYETCFERGIHVITPSSAFARPVAEMALGMAIDLCRGDHRRRPGDAGGQGEVAARRRRRLLLALRPAGRADRLRRPGARLCAAASRRSAARSRLMIPGCPTISWPVSASPPLRSTTCCRRAGSSSFSPP